MTGRPLWIAAVLALVTSGPPPVAQAHPLAPSLLRLEQRDDATIEARWRTPTKGLVGRPLRPVLDPRCRSLGPGTTTTEGDATQRDWRLDCGDAGLVGASVRIDGLAGAPVNVVVVAALADGSSVQALLHSARTRFIIPEERRAGSVVASYLVLGIEHLIFGLDHLLLLLGLVCLVGGRRLLLAVSAFTVGHSVTLVLAATGVVALPQGPVEIAIAASLVLVAIELTRPGPMAPGLIARHPWWTALVVGLIHGLGFAGALTEVGLPDDALAPALLGFNLGIELAQLAIVVPLLALTAHLRAHLAPLRRPTVELASLAIGSLGAFWVLDRTLALLPLT